MMTELKIKATNVFERNLKAYQSGKRFIINVGGTRSSKTYSICQLVIAVCLRDANTSVSVVRKTFPALRASVMKDILAILKELGIYNQNNHHKTEFTYKFDNGSEIVFFSADNDLKLRGRQHDIVWINEGNELSYDIFSELNQRTRKSILIDFNPSDMYSYIYDLYKRPESIKIHSNYKDNPFLPSELIREIEYYKENDPWRWRVMGLGEVGESPELIFDTIEYYDNMPTNSQISYGADWGFKDPTTIVKVGLLDGVYGWELYIEEILYETHLKPQEIKVKFEMLLSKDDDIYCDHRPEYVSMLEDFNIKNANKSIYEGLMAMKDCRIFIKRDSANTIREFQNYKWKKVSDRITDVPVDFHNHAIDAARYATMGLKKGKGVKDWNLLF